MDAKQIAGAGDGVAVNFAGMSKNQLYDIVCKMKALIEQNPQQARDILIQNPLLTKALFQAQIMLGMVQAPQVIPKIQLSASQQPLPVVQPSQPMNGRPSHSVPAKVNFPDETTELQIQVPPRDQHVIQPVMPIPSAVLPAVKLESQSMSANALQPQPQMHQNIQATTMSIPELAPPVALARLVLSASQLLPIQQMQMPTSNQLQRPMQTGRIAQVALQQPIQQPLPSQVRNPESNQQYPLQMGPNVGFHQSGGPQQATQPLFPPPSSIGSFAQGQHPVRGQLPVVGYQAGNPQSTVEFRHQVRAAMQIDRGGYGMPGLSEQSITAAILPPLHPASSASAPAPAQTATLSPGMQMALLQQVMSLTPEQINNLPPEQRNQLLQLQRMLQH